MSTEQQQEAAYDGFDWYTVADESFPEFSREEVEVFIQTFKEFDKDGSRSIDSNELATCLKAMGQGATPEELKTFMDIVDVDKSGEIEWPEFLRLMRLFYPERRAAYNRTFLDPARKFPEFTKDDITAFIRVFRSFDEDGSGSINLYELKKMFKAMGQGATDEELQEIISFADNDGSGEIEFDEFLRIMRMFYPDKRRAFERQFYLPAVDFPEFVRDEIDVFIQAFREFDTDGSGAINAKELETAFKAMGQATDPREIQKIFELVDEDQSGEIEWPEFLTIMRFLYPEKRAKFIRDFYVPANDFPEFTKPEIDVFVQAFRKFDLDGSGSIDARELHIALLAMGVGSTPEAAQKILRSVDANNSGVIEWPEFLQIMRLLYPDRLKEFEAEYYGPAKKFPQFSKDDVAVFIQAFRTFDLDGSKSINAKELGLVFKTMGQGMTEGQIKQIIQQFDTDGSGEIEWEEFLSIMAALYGDAPAPAQKQAAPQKAEAPKEEAPKVEAPKVEPKAEPPKANPTPAPVQTFQKAPTAQPPAKEAPKVQVGAQRSTPQCPVCSKTVYPLEALSAGDKVFHKGCFRCQAEGCGLTLTLKNYVVSSGQVFCQKHTPKDKPTSVGVDGNITMKSAVSAPKLNKQTGIQKNVRTTFGPGELNVEKK